MRKKRELEALEDTGRLIDAGKITLGQWLDRWLEVYKKPTLKPSTWFSNKNLMDLHIKPALGDKQLDRLRASEPQTFYNRLSTHALRHTFCTILLEQGEDLSTVSKLARHSSYSITADIYGHLTKSMQDKAADKLDVILKR